MCLDFLWKSTPSSKKTWLTSAIKQNCNNIKFVFIVFGNSRLSVIGRTTPLGWRLWLTSWPISSKRIDFRQFTRTTRCSTLSATTSVRPSLTGMHSSASKKWACSTSRCTSSAGAWHPTVGSRSDTSRRISAIIRQVIWCNPFPDSMTDRKWKFSAIGKTSLPKAPF